MAERLIDKLRQLLASAEGREVTLRQLRDELRLEPGSAAWESIRMSMKQLEKQKVVKPSGRSDGMYKVLLPIQPVVFSLDGDDKEGILAVRFPRSYIDDSSFGLEDFIELSEGDLVVVTGETNYGKTTIALTILGENLGLLKGNVLMGTEYTSSAGEISPKLKRRLRRMEWAKWIENGEPRFKLLPVEHDYEDYIIPDYLTVIDWLTLPGEYYMIDSVMKTIKNSIGRGLGVVVVQKNKGAEFAEGGQRSERYADLVLKIDRFGKDESILTIGKVKAAKGKSPSGRTFAFTITDYGANLQYIREVVKCPKCWARGYIKNQGEPKRCPVCQGKKFINKTEKEQPVKED